MESVDPETGEVYFRADLWHIVCCREDVGLCGMSAPDEPATSRTEDCWTCLNEEERLNREKRGCGSPRCPFRSRWTRLRYQFRSWAARKKCRHD